MVYICLRDKNVYPHLQQQLLKRFIDKQTVKLQELTNVNSEIVTELLEALKEIVLISQEKLCYL
jgi:hypothetical protein